jgi:hypothetical protein
MTLGVTGERVLALARQAFIMRCAMSDLIRFFAVLVCGAVLGCAGYWIGRYSAADLPGFPFGLALLGSVLGLVIGAWVNSGNLLRSRHYS